jgi:hypothetical protein
MIQKIDKKQQAEHDYRQVQELEKKGEFLTASFYCRNSLSMYRDLQDSKMQAICKKKLLEINKKAVAEFHKIEITQNVPSEVTERNVSFLNELMSGTLPEALDKIGNSPIFFPKYSSIVTVANQSMPLFASIASTSTIDNRGNIIRGSEDGEFTWKMMRYRIEQDIIIQLYLKNIFTSLISIGKLNKEDLMHYFENSGKVSKDDLKIIEDGIEAYFRKDFVSAMHILIPRLESLFLNLSENSGIDIIALNSGRVISTQTRTLSDIHLDSAIFKDVWGEDLCEQLNFVLFRPLGYKLRHRIAHGEITFKECNFANVSILLYFYVVLLTASR